MNAEILLKNAWSINSTKLLGFSFGIALLFLMSINVNAQAVLPPLKDYPEWETKQHGDSERDDLERETDFYLAYLQRINDLIVQAEQAIKVEYERCITNAGRNTAAKKRCIEKRNKDKEDIWLQGTAAKLHAQNQFKSNLTKIKQYWRQKNRSSINHSNEKTYTRIEI